MVNLFSLEGITQESYDFSRGRFNKEIVSEKMDDIIEDKIYDYIERLLKEYNKEKLVKTISENIAYEIKNILISEDYD